MTSLAVAGLVGAAAEAPADLGEELLALLVVAVGEAAPMCGGEDGGEGDRFGVDRGEQPGTR